MLIFVDRTRMKFRQRKISFQSRDLFRHFTCTCLNVSKRQPVYVTVTGLFLLLLLLLLLRTASYLLACLYQIFGKPSVDGFLSKLTKQLSSYFYSINISLPQCITGFTDQYTGTTSVICKFYILRLAIVARL
ncbi:hypothetical protein J3Q64DRAFT_1692851 [Phycomyces blakesleeanus]|uniref:Uncharacterized protein n=1 Tax=Phycomyces blakesleeanus TaxID=4837 RepID=A0ABR3BC21_PHYBL